MCGIAGLVGVSRSLAVQRVREAVRRLRHRGPDGEGWHESDHAVLGIRRLAVIDLATGDQPIYNEDRTIVVVCNGELYNYIERFSELEARGHRLHSQSDVNVIPHLYENAGREAFALIRGMFAVAIWDARHQRLVLARDQVGKKPLFYARVGTGIAFASELPALLALLDTSPSHSGVALADYLRLGFIPHPETVYQGVSALPPGCTLAFTPGGAPDVAPYWTPPQCRPFIGTRRDALVALDAYLHDAVSIRLRSDVPIGVFLSGGIDSGLVAAYAATASAKDLLCFVVEVQDSRLNEAPAARLTARWLGLSVETVTLSHPPLEVIERMPFLYGQPFADSSAIPTYLLSKVARTHRKVVLTGDGGDEIFAGYRRYWAGRAAPWLSRLPRRFGAVLSTVGRHLAYRRARRDPLGFLGRGLRALGTDDEARYLIWAVDLLDDLALSRCFPDLAGHGPTLPRLATLRRERTSCKDLRSFQMSDYRLTLPDQMLVKMDIATMANSVEARSPFLDVPLGEFAWSLPGRWLIGRETKRLLRALARQHLPPQVVSAPKRGFEVPVRRWLEHDLRQLVGDLLLSFDSRVADLGERDAVQDFVRGTDRFPGNHAQAVWALLILELFLRAPTPSPTPF